MEFLENIATAFWGFCSRVVALISPFGQDREMKSMGPGLRTFLHVLILSIVLVGLWWLNWWLEIDKLIVPPSFAPWMRSFWLPILFLLMYAMVWLGWWLWKLLGPEEQVSDFPDIDEAWEEAVQTLFQGQIDLTDAPLFLVIGKSSGGDDSLFNAAQLSLTIKQTPRRSDAPVHVFANKDGIYVTCPGASLLGRQAALLTGDADDAPSPAAASDGSADGASEEDMFKTLRPKGKLKEVQAILARAREDGRGPEQLSEAEKGEIRLLVAEEEAQQASGVRKAPSATLMKNPAEIERMTARLQHLCRLIVRDRRPYCPINGIMVLIPYAATDKDDNATQAGSVCQQDLAAARAILQVNCPVLALFCDLETAPGFREFVDRFPADQRQRRLGQRFPLVPDIDPETYPNMVDSGVAWISQSMFPNWVFKLFRLESPGREELANVVKGNARLYKLMGEMRERQKRLSRILQRAFASEMSGPPLFAGCYVGASGRDAAHEQAFVAGVFRRLVENQNYISWTDEALREEADNIRWSNYGYTGLAVAAASLFVLAAITWSRR